MAHRTVLFGTGGLSGRRSPRALGPESPKAGNTGPTCRRGAVAAARCRIIPARLNLALGSAILVVDAWAFFVTPMLGERAPVAAICSLALFVALAPIQWGLVHEAIHGILAGPGPMNRLAGRVLSVLLGHSFEVVRFGHLMHHAHTGHDFDCPDRAPPDGGASAGRVMIRHYGHILGGQYVLTAVSAWAALLPWRATRRLIAAALAGDGPGAVPIREAALRRFGPARRRAAIRADVVAAFSLPALSGFLYGPAWPWLVSALYGRALLLSLMDNMPHYGVGGSNAAEIPIFRASGWLSLLVMNHHLHRIHHLQPALPWVELPVEFARQDGRYDTAYANGILRQFRGPTRA